MVGELFQTKKYYENIVFCITATFGKIFEIWKYPRYFILGDYYFLEEIMR